MPPTTKHHQHSVTSCNNIRSRMLFKAHYLHLLIVPDCVYVFCWTQKCGKPIKTELFMPLDIIYSISRLTDSADKITARCGTVMGTDCISEPGGTGAANCVSKSFLSSLSKQLINVMKNSVRSKFCAKLTPSSEGSGCKDWSIKSSH